MRPNQKTRQVHVGNVALGGGAPVVVQSMLNAPADDAQANLAQIQQLADAGCEVVRMAIPRRSCLDTFQAVCEESPLPVVADVHFDATIAINLRAPWLMAVAALPFLKASGAGRIINLSSQAGVVAIDEHAAYGSSKAGLILLTKILALEWAQFGITTNAIAPTVVETPMALVGWSGEKGVQARQEIPVGRFAKPSEIAAAAAYLASEDAGIINGETLMADGGFTIR